MQKPVALAADHGGFALKEEVRRHLDEIGVPYQDFGTHSADSVDYPDMALPACDAVVSGACGMALLFCGTGVGMSNIPAATMTPTPFAWAAASSARGLRSSWWICF